MRRLRGKPIQGPLSFSKIQKILKKRRPICVMVQWGEGTIMHFVVISGCAKSSSGDKWVDIEDPDSGRSTWLYKEFRSNYQYYERQVPDPHLSGEEMTNRLKKSPPSRAILKAFREGLDEMVELGRAPEGLSERADAQQIFTPSPLGHSRRQRRERGPTRGRGGSF